MESKKGRKEGERFACHTYITLLSCAMTNLLSLVFIIFDIQQEAWLEIGLKLAMEFAKFH